ncbi:MAG: response regulator transcription factor [Filimonas sp.]|nr:response regulator transcription factor [Filimonas sp.]
MAKILLVEDDVLFLKSITYLLKQHGYEVDAAKDGKEANHFLDSHLYDLVITDLMLPFVHGFELVHKIKNKLSHKTPVIVISAITDEATITDSFKLGVEEYIKKPVIQKELLLRIQRIIQMENKIGIY